MKRQAVLQSCWVRDRWIALAAAVCVLAGSAGAGPFLRGDANGDGTPDISDAIAILWYLFAADRSPVTCEDRADADDSGEVQITDAVYLLTYLFASGPPPPAPFPRSGFDVTTLDPYRCGDVIGGAERPLGANLYVPAAYAGDTPVPLTLLLHGDGDTGAGLATSIGFPYLAEQAGFVAAWPDAIDTRWSLSENGHDSTYLRRIIDDVGSHYRIDPKRIYVLGLSAGGHMCYRLACDHGDVIAAILVSAGGMPQNVATCNPDVPVHVLHIHGTADQVVPYHGGTTAGGRNVLGAEAGVAWWAEHNGCAVEPETGERMDYDPVPPDDFETAITRYGACSAGGSAELWTVEEGGHVIDPGVRVPWLPWMLSRQKP
jgi:polyhydroxybutyrate depolymerase